MKITVSISVGEFLDKLTILWIKREMIHDPVKLGFINQEIQELEPVFDMLGKGLFVELVINQLHEVNRKMWNVNERRKSLLASGIFDEEYLNLTKEESLLNDSRFRIKQQINDHFGSEIKECKSYEGF